MRFVARISTSALLLVTAAVWWSAPNPRALGDEPGMYGPANHHQEPPVLGFAPHPARESEAGLSGHTSTPAPDGWQHEFPFVDFASGDPDAPQRSVGWGQPLVGTSWLNRPWHVDWFVGAINGDDLIDRQLDQHTGLFGGYRLGRDFDHYWGTELRVAFMNLQLADNQVPQFSRTSSDWMMDVHLQYYPWGDARWRPYFSGGFGFAEFRFRDPFGQSFKDSTIQMPLGCGLKYYWKNWLALRLDVMDNLAFSSEHVDTMHNVSLTGGVEIRFGGHRRSYYPWNPGVELW